MVITFVFEGVIEVVRLRKSWIGEEMLSEASLDDEELDFVVLLKQQGFTLILVVLAHDLMTRMRCWIWSLQMFWFLCLREEVLMVIV